MYPYNNLQWFKGHLKEKRIITSYTHFNTLVLANARLDFTNPSWSAMSQVARAKIACGSPRPSSVQVISFLDRPGFLVTFAGWIFLISMDQEGRIFQPLDSGSKPIYDITNSSVILFHN
jgi:hypothetical protein